MAYISTDLIEEVRNRVDIVEVTSSYINLKKAGRNFIGLCPFHSEKTPSFTVSPEKQIYHCFGCHSGGNVFTFLMQMEGLSFPEAVRQLGEQVGVRVSYRSSPEDRKEDHFREELLKMNSEAQEHFQETLWKSNYGKNILSYLRSRGLSEDIIKEFKLGFAPNSGRGLTSILQKKSYNLEMAVKGGLLGKKVPGKYYDYFRGRVMFPIYDLRGRLSGFGGRTVDEQEPKYLNTPETPLFHKGRTLYGLYQSLPHIRREGIVLLVEGYTDVLLLHQHGIKYAVAPLGTALTEKQLSLLRGKMGKVVLAFDADSGGQTAALKGIELLKNEGCRVNVALLPEGYDPADFVKEFGREAFITEVLDKARPVVDYQLYLLRKQCDLNREEDRVEYWKKARRILASISEIIEREEYMKKIAQEIGSSLEVLRRDLEKDIDGNFKSQATPVSVRNQFQGGREKNSSLSPRELAEKELLSCILKHPGLAEEVWAYFTPQDFSSETYRSVAESIYDLTQKQGEEIEIAAVLSNFSDQEMHKLIMEMTFSCWNENEDKSKAFKRVKDCIRKIKVIRWSEERERLIKLLQDGNKVEDVSSTLKRIQELKKWEEELIRTGEGERING